ncbi:hypothetical protein BB559_002980 [Furculomyces boomerangus]|uniref:Uncharacterized protein n=1 Tax=Furculomyces boomerangus TaxID=61424 RepID=A0A2T9YQH1_9FUNG|nr:hypothetical protein BB559_002980 [Furculomyces boomerangus]
MSSENPYIQTTNPQLPSQDPSNSPSTQSQTLESWDLIAAYRLNRKLLAKYKKALKSVDNLISKNHSFISRIEQLGLKTPQIFQDLYKLNSNNSFSTSHTLSGIRDLDNIRIFDSSRKTNNEASLKTKGRKVFDEPGFFGKTISGTNKFKSYFEDFQGNKPDDNIDTIKKKKQPPIISRARKWTEDERKRLAFGVRQFNKQILVQGILDSNEFSLQEKKQKIDQINNLKYKSLEMNLENLDWKIISKVYVQTQKPSACAIQWATKGHPIINKKLWSNSEIARLLELAEEHKGRDWVTVAKLLNTNRTAQQCFKLYQRKINSKLTLSKWTKEEDELLKTLVTTYGEGNWQTIAGCFHGRSAQQVLHRWYKSIDPNIKQGKWSKEEDQALLVGIRIFGVGKWNKISQFVKGRTDVKCRERYVNVLSPKVNRSKWTSTENLKLVSAVRKVGLGKWSLVADLVGTRSDNQCWRHWISLHRRGLAPLPEGVGKTDMESDKLGYTKKTPRAKRQTLLSKETSIPDQLKVNKSIRYTSSSITPKPPLKRFKRGDDNLDTVADDCNQKRRWKRVKSEETENIGIDENDIQTLTSLSTFIQSFSGGSTSKSNVEGADFVTLDSTENRRYFPLLNSKEDLEDESQSLDDTGNNTNEYFKEGNTDGKLERIPPNEVTLRVLSKIFDKVGGTLDAFNDGFEGKNKEKYIGNDLDLEKDIGKSRVELIEDNLKNLDKTKLNYNEQLKNDLKKLFELSLVLGMLKDQ